jgi:hypothetical protein
MIALHYDILMMQIPKAPPHTAETAVQRSASLEASLKEMADSQVGTTLTSRR